MFTNPFYLMSQLPKAAMRGILMVVQNWQLLILIPVVAITWTILSKFLDKDFQPKGPLKEIQFFIASHLQDIADTADRCGGQIFDPYAFMDCVGKK
ncbi:MAG: hypothetical protein K0R63_1570 [Rickettsiales bacterium]|jgi:hypothetical protein|nr:hypothetical protein [Rickettsiales bacterium]